MSWLILSERNHSPSFLVDRYSLNQKLFKHQHPLHFHRLRIIKFLAISQSIEIIHFINLFQFVLAPTEQQHPTISSFLPPQRRLSPPKHIGDKKPNLILRVQGQATGLRTGRPSSPPTQPLMGSSNVELLPQPYKLKNKPEQVSR